MGDDLVYKIIPDLVLQKTGLSVDKIVPKIVTSVAVLFIIFGFILMAMNAFTGAGGVSSFLQSSLAGGESLLVGKQGSSDSIDKIKRTVKDLVNSVMEIDKKKVQEHEKKKNQPSNDGKTEKPGSTDTKGQHVENGSQSSSNVKTEKLSSTDKN